MRLRRLAQMSFTEIADRSRQKAFKWVDRAALEFGQRRSETGLAVRAGEAVGTAASLDLFRHAAPRRLFEGVEKGDAAEILREELPAASRDIIATANGLFSRRFDLLGYRGLSFGQPIDWHRDPVSGRRAPFTHWSRIDPLDFDSVGDSKVIWELNRHQWVVPLAQAYWLTADRRYAAEVVDIVDDWCRANPYGVGINWASSLEVAFRLISWSWAFTLIRDAGALSEREFAGLLAQVQSHGSHVARYLSTYFSPNTHLTGEALGLFYASVLFAELPEATRWRRLSRELLIEECRRQVHADGVYFEQASCYQRYTIDIYLHFLILAARNDVTVPPDVRERVSRMVEFLVGICGPDGAMPAIGDADGGWLLPLARRSASDCRGTFAAAAAVFGRSDFLQAAGGPAPEVLWLLGESAWRRLGALKEGPQASASRLFSDGGYAVMRGGGTRDAHHLIVDVGPLGVDSSGAHAHADMLAVQCTAFGAPYIVDPGTFTYTGDRGLREYFRGTAAHSTVMVDGLPQATPRGPFGWRNRPAAKVHRWETSSTYDLVDASHDAYADLADPVTHRRRVYFSKPAYWVIVDDLIGSASHRIELRFQLAPKKAERKNANWVAIHGRRGEGVWLAPFAAVPLTLTLLEGSERPLAGWVSADYGEKHPAPMLVCEAATVLPVRIVTLVLPSARMAAGPPAVTMLTDSAGMVASLRFEESGEVIRFDEATVSVETHDVGAFVVPATPGSQR